MIDRILVEYLHDGHWTWSRDYPVSHKEDALEYARNLWRNGAAGVRVSQTVRSVIVEHIRSSDAASRRPTRSPRPTGEASQ